MAAVVAIAEVVGGEDQALGDAGLQAGEQGRLEECCDALAEGLGQGGPVGGVSEAEVRHRGEGVEGVSSRGRPVGSVTLGRCT